MKEILLFDLIVRNFMGVKLAEIHPKGKSITIIGENEAGKTRFATGWNWLLFDKDIYGKSNFDIKWLDENNNVKDPGLEYIVEGDLSVDGKKMNLKKVFYEQWQKKKGSNKERFTGHTTDYYINDVPRKKKEYDAEINQIIDEETFRTLTDPDYFCGKIRWDDRRSFLMNTYGTLSDKEIIEQNEDLHDLLEVIEIRGIDEHKAMCKSQMTEINKQIKKLPTRINECSQGLPDVTDYDQKKIEAEIKKLKKQKKAKEAELARVENGGEIAEKKKRLTEIDTELQQIKNEHTAEYDEKIQEKKKELSGIKDQLEAIEREISSKKTDIEEKEEAIKARQDKMKSLIDDWHQKQHSIKLWLNQEFDESGLNYVTCPECNHKFPLEDLEEHKKRFNQAKAEKIEKLTEEKNNINENGLQKKEEVEKLQSEIEDIKAKVEELERQYNDFDKSTDNLREEIYKLKKQAEAYQDSKDYKAKTEEKKALQEEIDQLKESNKFSLQKVDKEITVLEEQIETEKDKIKEIDDYKKGQKRIDELKAEERKLAKKYEDLERQVDLCEEFTRAKVSALEGEINSHFKYTDWKLFDELVNGGIDETCEALHKGVAYNSTLNTGAKILVGVDVINTLSEHYGIRVPVFVDNYESLTRELESECQLIKLKAVEGVKKLRVEEAG